MRTKRTIAAIGFLVVLGFVHSGTGAREQTTAPSRHALLIGVTRYANLAEQYQLEGPINDVALVRRTLLERLGIPADRIVELTERKGAAGRPTYANIRREFERLAKVVGRGDQVLILFAGHGSQQPDGDGAGKDESDGLDEIFLPADAAGWDGAAGTVQNALVDDQINAWVGAIRGRGAFTWLVFDSCQSSTMTRGSVERSRMVPPAALVPQAVLDSAREKTRGADEAESSVIGVARDGGRIAALYAAQTTEPTPEKHLPDSKGPVHGLFTYTLVEVLGQAKSAISYRDLIERVAQRYRALGRGGPTPGFEGGGLDEPVLGAANASSQSRFVIGDQKEGPATLRAGSIHGITRGTILRLFPPAGAPDADRVIGHVKVVDLDPIESRVEPAAFAELPAPARAQLVPNSRAEVALLDYGEHVLKVALHPDARKSGSAAAVDRALAELFTKTSGVAEAIASVEAAQWIANVKDGEVVLASASGWRVDAARRENPDAQVPFRVGKVASPTLPDELSATLSRIARARALMQLAVTTAPGSSEVDVDIDVIRYTDGQDKVGAPVPVDNGGRTLHAGDRVAFRVRNTGSAAADVTLLFIDSQYGITMIFPARDAEIDSRLARDAEVVTPRMTVNADTIGLEQIVALAVQTSKLRTDFRYLEQPSLELARSRGAGTSPFEQLLHRAMYGQGTTRGLGDREAGRHAIRMLTWHTDARPRGAGR